MFGSTLLLTLCWHSFPHYSSHKEGRIRCPLHADQRGVCHAAVGLLERLPTWKYHIPVPGGGAVCNCVLSDLRSPSHSFVPDIFLRWIYFSLFGIFVAVPLVTKFSYFPSSRLLRANDESVCKLHYVWKEDVTPHLEKVTPGNWWMTNNSQMSFLLSVLVYILLVYNLSGKHSAGIGATRDHLKKRSDLSAEHFVWSNRSKKNVFVTFHSKTHYCTYSLQLHQI